MPFAGWALILCALVVGPTSAGAQVLDRIVAVVGGQPITASDVRAARALGLVTVEPATDEAIRDRLIDRELMRAEVDRFSVPASDRAEVDAGVSRARARLAPAEGRDPLEALGMTDVRLRTWIDDDRRIEGYLHQRFDVAAQPTDDEVLTYFRSREREFLKDGLPQSFAAVQDQVRAHLVSERRNQLIEEWLAGLKRRASIVILPAGPGLPNR